MTTRYVIEERQIARLNDDRPEAAVEIGAGPLAILTFLGFTNTGTGGNCEASTIALANGFYVLVADDSREPSDGWSTLEAAMYNAEGDEQDDMTYWCDAGDPRFAADEIDAFAMDMVEYANLAEAAKTQPRPIVKGARRLTDIEVREPDHGPDIEFGVFCRGEWSDSINVSLARAIELHRELGELLKAKGVAL